MSFLHDRSGSVRIALALVLLVSCSGHETPASAIPAYTPTGRMVLDHEVKLSKLFGKDLDHYEGSGVALRDGSLYVVFDDSPRLGIMDVGLTTGRLGPGATSDSQFESITASQSGFYVIEEADPSGRSQVYAFDKDGIAQPPQPTDVVFADPNKGIEGAAWLSAGGTEYLLALCEGNFCTSDETSYGNGRIKVLALENGRWITQTTLSVPPAAAFADYADLALRDAGDGTFDIAVLSQSSAALWLGKLTTSPLAISGPGNVYDFPKNADGTEAYCELEGVTFLSATTFAMVSDKTNDKTYCNDKDTSAHIFRMP